MPQCIVINLRSAISLILIFVLSGIQQSLSDTKDSQKENNLSNNNDIAISPPLAMMKNNDTTTLMCNGNTEVNCAELQFPCIRCTYVYTCHYGKNINISCSVASSDIQCVGERSFSKEMNCRYCYQTEPWQQKCVLRGNCNAAAEQYYRTNCTVHPDVFCLGNRSFTKNLRCNWTQGYRWSTALILSILLGGFGADRFYLGHWQEGIGKLFSFGGLGVWTIIDVLLISLHYLGPADGSLYI